MDMAVAAFNKHDYLRAAILSWSCIEECFLPKLIQFIATQQKMELEKSIIERASSHQLIHYYLMISYDKELYNLLEEGRRLRNNLIHKIYKTGSIKDLEKNAKICADYNLKTLSQPILDRFTGKTKIPSLSLYAKGWNDSNEDFRKILQKRIDDLEASIR